MINVSIRRGATPTLIIHMDTDLRDAVEITLTVKQEDISDPWIPCPVSTYTFGRQRMDVEEKLIKVRLTQEETLALSDKTDYTCQLVAEFADGTVVPSTVMWGLVGGLLEVEND